MALTKKTIYTLRVGGYSPRIWHLTEPLMRAYANKIGADLVVMTERRWPGMPITVEKFSVARLAKERGDEWSIFFDADTLINPEFFDPTVLMTMDQVAHNGNDYAGMRWLVDDPYFLRDGRFISSCTWCVIASKWTVEDLWRMPDLTLDEMFGRFDENGQMLVQPRINITVNEHNSNHCKREHLIDDYTLSRNIARFGLKFTTLIELCAKAGYSKPVPHNPSLWHAYAISEEEKLHRMLAILAAPQGMLIPEIPEQPQAKPPIGVGWGLMLPSDALRLRQEWNIRPDWPIR